MRVGSILTLSGVLTVAAACGPQKPGDEIRDTMQRVESIRELSATADVPYRFLPTADAFDDILDGWAESDDAQEIEAEAVVYKKLGLLPLDLDILEVLEWSTRVGVLGYYDPEDKIMTVVSDSDELDGADLMVLAHEHAHALQDQHYGLEQRMEAADDDEAVALRALTEGEATLVMAIWTVKRLGAADLEELTVSDIPTDVAPIDEMPPILLREGEFPYVDGAAFVYSIWETGGWEAIDALWAAPPVSSEQILHPERYPGDVPEVVDLPDVAAMMGEGWRQTVDMTMGEMRIGVLLAGDAPWSTDEEVAFSFPELENADAATGWGGDGLLHVEGPGDAWAILWQTSWDSSRDASEFTQALQDSFGSLPYAWGVVEGADVSVVTHPHPVLVLVAGNEETYARALRTVGPLQLVP